MLQAIVTKWLPCTVHKPARIKATCAAGSLTMSIHEAENAWEDLHPGKSCHPDNRHEYVAVSLRNKMGWSYRMHGGGLPDQSGFAFVMEDNR